jgi:hypothetical protein
VAAEGESIRVHELCLDWLVAMAERGDLRDLKTMFLVHSLRLGHPELFGRALIAA